MTGPKRVTAKQLAANRANAQRSTGPRSAEGKAVVSQNAVKHGILARAVIPPGLEPYESRDEFDQLHQRLVEAFAPANALEELLVEQVAVGYWRLARLYRSEAGTIAARLDEAEKDFLFAQDWAKQFPSPVRTTADRMHREEDKLKSVLKENSALRKYMEARNVRWGAATDDEVRAAAEARLAEVSRWLDDEEQHIHEVDDAVRSFPTPDAALIFARYEATLQNQLHRALTRLERLQRLRAGDLVPAPFQLDITGLETPHADD